MTGEKNRGTTQEKLWKLDDEQLATPKHDEMVIELLTKENLLKFIPGLSDWFEGIYEIKSEHPIGGDFVVGYWDVLILHQRNDYYWECIGIEVKPVIDSFGKVLRQLNSYKHARTFRIEWGQKKTVELCNVYLFTTDLRFKKAFESQGIWVISP